mmetsp:Transcript_69872/g.202732  ORF Transcript_69872/g.202732 Transcript_69872/m.202732 type:complete len:233 (+) Transcript_69872:395-1093(+)
MSSVLKCWRNGIWSAPLQRLRWHLCKAAWISKACTNLRPHSSTSEDLGAAATSWSNTKSNAWLCPLTNGKEVVWSKVASSCTSSAGNCQVSPSTAVSAGASPVVEPSPCMGLGSSSSSSSKARVISRRKRASVAAKSSSSSSPPNKAEAVSAPLAAAAALSAAGGADVGAVGAGLAPADAGALPLCNMSTGTSSNGLRPAAPEARKAPRRLLKIRRAMPYSPRRTSQMSVSG